MPGTGEAIARDGAAPALPGSSRAKFAGEGSQ